MRRGACDHDEQIRAERRRQARRNGLLDPRTGKTSSGRSKYLPPISARLQSKPATGSARISSPPFPRMAEGFTVK